jgi:hypothetical protein
MYWTQIGQCCGTLSLYGFSVKQLPSGQMVPDSWSRKKFKEYTENRHRTRGLLQTAILKPRQVQGWHGVLIESGFTVSHKWRNTNTGQLLTMYTKITGHASEQKELIQQKKELGEKRYLNDSVSRVCE